MLTHLLVLHSMKMKSTIDKTILLYKHIVLFGEEIGSIYNKKLCCVMFQYTGVLYCKYEYYLVPSICTDELCYYWFAGEPESEPCPSTISGYKGRPSSVRWDLKPSSPPS